MELSIIIPCFNEAANIASIVERFLLCKPKDLSVELVLVDNGSTDSSQEQISKFLEKNNNIHCFSIPVNEGYGNGIWQGLKSAKGEYLCWTHADLQTDIKECFEAYFSILSQNDKTNTYVKGMRTDGRTITERMLKKTKKYGFKAIIFTVDAPQLGTRERDERNKFKMPDHLSLGNFKGTILEKFDNRDGSSMNMHNELLFDKSLTFEIIPWIKEVSELPVLVKGILRPDDALLCFKHGADGIIISNHGGRQLDTATPTLKQIEPIRKEVGKEKLLIVDGGIRRGTDILKCIALGANAVQIGRPILWGLNYGGEAGVGLVLDILLKEFIETMILTGCRNLNEITRDLVRKI